jgi:hypothetical protein
MSGQLSAFVFWVLSPARLPARGEPRASGATRRSAPASCRLPAAAPSREGQGTGKEDPGRSGHLRTFVAPETLLTWTGGWSPKNAMVAAGPRRDDPARPANWKLWWLIPAFHSSRTPCFAPAQNGALSARHPQQSPSSCRQETPANPSANSKGPLSGCRVALFASVVRP